MIQNWDNLSLWRRAGVGSPTERRALAWLPPNQCMQAPCPAVSCWLSVSAWLACCFSFLQGSNPSCQPGEWPLCCMQKHMEAIGNNSFFSDGGGYAVKPTETQHAKEACTRIERWRRTVKLGWLK